MSRGAAADRGEPPLRGAVRGRRGRPARRYRWRAGVPAPGGVLPRRLDRLPDDLHDLAELLRPHGQQRSSASTTTGRCSRTDTLRTAIENNAIWVAVVPALVTAIGLIFAVLTERIRWSVAFKTVVFMPMAISLFAAGVIWRLVYEQDPNRGALNAAIAVVHDAFSPTGVLAGPGRRSRPCSWCAATAASTLKQPVQAGRHRAARPDGDPARARCRRAPSRRRRRSRGRAPSSAPSGATSSRAAASRGWWSRASSGCPGVHGRAARRGRQDGGLGEDRRRRRLPVHRAEGRGPTRRRSRRPRSRKPYGGVVVAVAAPDHARDHDRLHLGLGRVLDGGDRARAWPPSRGTCWRRRAPTARGSGTCSAASPRRCSRRC